MKHRKIEIAILSFMFTVVACGTSHQAKVATKLTTEPKNQQQSVPLTFEQTSQISITSPAVGAFVQPSQDGTVEVAGTANGNSITVNGQVVAVNGGSFSAKIPANFGINVISAKLNQAVGGEAQRAFLYGNFAPSNATIPSGILVRTTAPFYDDHSGDLDDLSVIAKTKLNQLDLLKLIGELPPVSYNFGIGSVDMSVTTVSYAKDKLALDLSPKATGAHINGGLASINIGLKFVLHLGGDYEADAVVAVDTVGFDGDIDAHFDPAAHVPDLNDPFGTNFTIEPGIDASMALPTISLGTIKITTNLKFNGIDDFLTWLANQMKNTIASVVAQGIQQNSANHFALALNEVGLPSSFDLNSFGLPAVLSITDVFDNATSFDDQGATISVTTNLAWPSSPALGPNNPGPSAPGSLVVGSSPTTQFPQATIGVSLAFDVLNQALFAVWGQNGLVRTVLPATNLGVFNLDPVVATPRLPPVMLPTTDGRVTLALGDIEVTTALHTFGFDGPVKVTLSANVDVTLGVDSQNGALVFTLSGTPQVFVDVNDLFGLVPDALLLPLSEALQAFAPTIIENVVKPIEVPLPTMSLNAILGDPHSALGLAPPVQVAIDEPTHRLIVSGDVVLVQK